LPIISKTHLIPRGLGLTKVICGGGPLLFIKHEEYNFNAGRTKERCPG